MKGLKQHSSPAQSREQPSETEASAQLLESITATHPRCASHGNPQPRRAGPGLRTFQPLGLFGDVSVSYPPNRVQFSKSRENPSQENKHCQTTVPFCYLFGLHNYCEVKTFSVTHQKRTLGSWEQDCLRLLCPTILKHLFQVPKKQSPAAPVNSNEKLDGLTSAESSNSDQATVNLWGHPFSYGKLHQYICSQGQRLVWQLRCCLGHPHPALEGLCSRPCLCFRVQFPANAPGDNR